MAYIVQAPRVGRSQGAVIFWGLVSAFFASAFCYYYLENRTNEDRNRTLVEQVANLQDERDSLDSDRKKMEAAAGDTNKQLLARQEFLQDKETKLAQEESDIESMGTQTQSQSQQSAAQAAGVKKFDDAVRKIVAENPNSDVVLRGGRPVLRLPGSLLFAPGNTQLKPDGRTLLTQIAAAANGPAHFELRVETFTDSNGETPDAAAAGGSAKPAPKPATVDAWTLTAGRAAAIAHYLRDSGSLPFQDVLVVPRADFQPVVPGAKDDHGRNRRVEITITPQPAAFHAPEPATARGKNGKAGAPGANAAPSAAPAHSSSDSDSQ